MSPSRAPHSPLGARASFDFGPPGATAGFAVPAGAGTEQDVFVGCRSSPREPWSLLPFFQPVPGGPQPLPKGRFGRFVAWAGDKWMIGPLVFKLCTPFPLHQSDERFDYAPIVCGYLEYDNSHSTDSAELIFGTSGTAETLPSNLRGFAFGATHGFAAGPSAEIELCRDVGVFGIEIGPTAALRFLVPPQSKRIFPLALGFFQPGFHYARDFADLAAVLTHGLAGHARYLAASDQRDAEFMRSGASFEIKTRVASETRAWLAQSRRLAGQPPLDLAPLRSLARELGVRPD